MPLSLRLVFCVAVLGTPLSVAALTSPAQGTVAQTVRFSGDGGKTLPPFRITRPSTMYWTEQR